MAVDLILEELKALAALPLAEATAPPKGGAAALARERPDDIVDPRMGTAGGAGRGVVS